MAEELKACPFCGGEPNLTHSDYVHDDLRPMPVVECKSCSAWVRAEDWNTRAQVSQGGEAVAWAICKEPGRVDWLSATYANKRAAEAHVASYKNDLTLYITPLYTHPADQVADDLNMVKVSRELLERIAGKSCDPDCCIAYWREELRQLLAKSEWVKP